MADAIKAHWATYRLVPSRDTFQLVLEAPASEQAEIFKTLGYPLPGSTIWVGVCRLQNPETTRFPVSGAPPDTDPQSAAILLPPQPSGGAIPKAKDIAKSERAKEWFAQLDEEDKVVATAAMLCKDAAFRAWIGARDEDQAARFVRWRCGGINSRRELATNRKARARFEELLNDYQLATGRVAEVRG